jgi:hypothetical protein
MHFLPRGIFPAVTSAEPETASLSWRAYRSATPEACFVLLKRDLTALPLLRPALDDLLKQLPGPTGLGATELRLLELVEQDTRPGHPVLSSRAGSHARVL